MGQVLRDKTLHPLIAEKVIERYEAGFYDDAVLAAFKVVEVQLRTILKATGGTSLDLINIGLSPTKGTLQDPNALPADREALYAFFRGAFGLFRNPQGHSFPELDADQAFDQIVVADMLMKLLDQTTEDKTLEAIVSGQIPEIQWRGYPDEPHQFMLDTDNDGVLEFVIVSREFDRGSPFKVYDSVGPDTVSVPVESLGEDGYSWPPEDIILVDIDGDGENEILAALGGDTTTALVFYKYVDGSYKLMLKDVPPEGYWRKAEFIDAHIADVDDDGRIEVVSQPWGSVPDSLWPSDRPRNDHDWGRVKYVWRWNPDVEKFRLVEPPELLYIGGR